MSKLVQFDPFAQITALRRQFLGDDWLMPSSTFSMPTTDVYTDENNSKMIVEAHLPNFEDKDVDVYIDDGALIIQAERREQEKDKSKKYVVRESSSSFYRRIHLPERANATAIEANLTDGILKVTVPFKELPTPQKIAISSKASNAKSEKSDAKTEDHK